MPSCRPGSRCRSRRPGPATELAIGRPSPHSVAGLLARGTALTLHGLFGLWLVFGVLFVPDQLAVGLVAVAAVVAASWLVFVLPIVGRPRRSRLVRRLLPFALLLPFAWLMLWFLVAMIFSVIVATLG